MLEILKIEIGKEGEDDDYVVFGSGKEIFVNYVK